jgi:hypothetical protein
MIALALLAFLAACGGATHAPPKVSAGPGLHPGKASGALTRSEAAAFARAVRLLPGDVPGFAPSRERQHPETAAERRAGQALRACIGAPAQAHSAARPSSEQGSLNYTREDGLGLQTISSSVEVLPSSVAASLELEFVRKAHTRACMASFLTSLLARLRLHGGSISPVTVQPFNPSAQGTAGAFGWHVGATISIHGLKLALRFDLLGFAYRSAVVRLSDLGFPRIPEAQEQRLFALLLARARNFPNEPPATPAAAQPA